MPSVHQIKNTPFICHDPLCQNPPLPKKIWAIQKKEERKNIFMLKKKIAHVF
jgi:hypothetical protein